MASANLFKVTVSPSAPLDGSQGGGTGDPQVSAFLTVQSLANFSAMTGGIIAAWNGLKLLNPNTFGHVWVPFAFAAAFGLVSLLLSTDAMKKDGKWDVGLIVASIFIAVINSLVLASAVIGAETAYRGS